MNTQKENITARKPFLSSFPVKVKNTLIRLCSNDKKVIGGGIGKQAVKSLIALNIKNHPKDALFLNGRVIHFGDRSQKEGYTYELKFLKAENFKTALVAILFMIGLFLPSISMTAQDPGEVLYLQGRILKKGDSKEKTKIIVLDNVGDTVLVKTVKNRYKLKFNLNSIYTVIMIKGDSTKQFNIDTRTGVLAFSKLLLDIDWSSRYNYAILNISDNGRELVVHGEYKTIEKECK